MAMNDKPLPQSKAGQRWVRFWRKIYNPIGFNKGYNFPLFVILVGVLMGFTLARLQYLDVNGLYLPQHTIPGDAVTYLNTRKRIAITIHLACVLPAAFLVCFQFVPIIRYKVLLFHRLNGYAVILLLLASNASGYVLAPTAAGGHPVTQAGVGMIASMTTIGILLAYVNVKRLQIDQHRAWMIRTWVWAGSIISQRLILFASQDWVNRHPGSFYDVQSCAHIWYQYVLFGAPLEGPGNPVPQLYPECQTPNNTIYVAVKAVPSGNFPEQITGGFNLLFGLGLWLALAIHAFGVELYLWLTPAESERLRNVSYEKQVEAGFKKPGCAGLTAHRLGDALPWTPAKTAKIDSNSNINEASVMAKDSQSHHQ